MATKANARGYKGAKNRKAKRGVMNSFRKDRPLDKIQDDVKALAAGQAAPYVKDVSRDAEELPGGGAHYCVTCARHFVDAPTLALHSRSKLHKQQVKRVAEEQYTQKDADAAAGMAPTR